MSGTEKEKPVARRFKIIEDAGKTPSQNHSPNKGLLYKSGLIEMNRATRRLAEKIAQRENIPVEQFSFLVGMDEATKQIGLYLVSPDTPGATGVRRTKAGLSFSVTKVLTVKPEWRPTTPIWCPVTVDPKESNCLVLNLGTAVPKGVGRSRSSSGNSAAAEQPD